MIAVGQRVEGQPGSSTRRDWITGFALGPRPISTETGYQ
jgi:hypothetical protein